MISVRFPPILTGAAALSLILAAPGFAQQQQQQQSTGQQGQSEQSTIQATTPANTADDARNAGAAGQVVQQLEDAQQALEQGDADTARQALSEAFEMLQKAAVEGEEERLVQIRQQLEQAKAALQAEDMETAQAAIGAAAEGMIEIERTSAQEGTQQAASQGDQQGSEQQGSQGAASQDSQQQGSQEGTQQAAQGGQQGAQQQVSQESQQSAMQDGPEAPEDALRQAREALESARQEIDSALQAVQDAEKATLAQSAGGGSSGDAVSVTVVDQGGGQSTEGTSAEGQQASAEKDAAITVVDENETEATRAQPTVASAEQQVPRLSTEETNRLLGMGGREIGQATEMLAVPVADLRDHDVITLDGERIGEIGQVVTTGDKIYAVIEHGGFLGIGENKVAIPTERLGMRGDEIVLLGLTEEQLEQMPEYDFGSAQELSQDQAVELGRYN